MMEPLLSDLCSIWTPKYCCPRCKTQTCSLPCYKRHQQRAACSGKRDPTTFVKKTEWATPAGLDHDYNYLKNVERTINHASRPERQSGTGNDSVATRGVAKAWQSESALRRYLGKNHITVAHAPKGMSRQTTNQTRNTKNGNVVWTVEWVDDSGKHYVQNHCQESASLHGLYSVVRGQTGYARKRRAKNSVTQETRPQVTKRKRVEVKDQIVHGSADDLQDQKSENIGTSKLEESFGSSDLKTRETNGRSGKFGAPATKVEPGMNNAENAHDSDSSTSSVHFILDREDSRRPTDQLATPSDSQQMPSEQISLEEVSTEQHFYLLRTATSARSLVLCPLRSEMTLTEALRNRTVQEYPTIYVLPHPPGEVGPGFSLETDYLNAVESKHKSVRNQEFTAGLTNACGSGTRSQVSSSSATALDTKSILDMLRRDTTA